MGLADDPEAFLGTFDWVAMDADWEKATWALWLALCLTGEAHAAYMALSVVQTRDYEVVREAVLS